MLGPLKRKPVVMNTRFVAPFGALVLALALAGGCNADKSAVKANPKSCEDYAGRICKEAGEESPTCETIKTATGLMAPEACAVALTKVDFSIKKLGEKRQKCDELTKKLCGDLGPTTATCELVTSQTKTFPPERCEAMLGQYPAVLADLQRMESRNKPLDADKIAKISSADAPSFGPADAKVTVVEFSDFECPYCSRAADVANKVKEKYGDKVRFVFRQFPLSFHQNAHVAAQASLAANAQGKFWAMHDKMFQNQKALDRASLEGFAKEAGLDMASFKKALDDKTFAATVDAELKLGEEVAVDGTPTMFLNGARVGNPTDFDALSKQIDEALAKAGG
jgi:protein-disulfide isomerase